MKSKGKIKAKIKSKNNYECTICGERNVKLWHPYAEQQLLICAKCAEERQIPRRYQECIWTRKGDRYVGKPTGRKLPMPKWKVNRIGKIPSDIGPNSEGQPIEMTNQLCIDLSDISKHCISGHTTVIPAYPDGNGGFLDYRSVSDKDCKEWEKLPTRR